jgi:uncharacterized protein (TIGR02466 family)
MKSKLIMPSHVYGQTQTNLNKKYISQLLATIELLRRGDINGAEFSNVTFGWQSSNLPMNGVFIPLLQTINEKCLKFCRSIKNFKCNKIDITNFWANINYKNDINWPHKHQGDLSGVLYLQTKRNSGNLILQDDSVDLNNNISKFLSSKSTIGIEPKVNKLVIFDSNLVHLVTKNLNNEPRISISFNAKVYV